MPAMLSLVSRWWRCGGREPTRPLCSESGDNGPDALSDLPAKRASTSHIRTSRRCTVIVSFSTSARSMMGIDRASSRDVAKGGGVFMDGPCDGRDEGLHLGRVTLGG